MCIRDRSIGRPTLPSTNALRAFLRGSVHVNPWRRLTPKRLYAGLLVSPSTTVPLIRLSTSTTMQHLRRTTPVSYTHLRAHETPEHLVCRLLLEKKKKQKNMIK
eukprot:TRINITY_DN6463_c0_g1_i1.p1 TRINITY_DN6463_c0_g1~~TRINITY_DN6463_c0_g1_i1.p1  ORF type:complete len:104 (-),score=17.34 TRINITY_DN6463_c0_g1_i1:54-365(-)